jgi:hypothetical protein
LSKVTGVTFRGVERVSTAQCLDLLEVGPDPVLRQRVRNVNPRPSGRVFPELLARRCNSRVLTVSAISATV